MNKKTKKKWIAPPKTGMPPGMLQDDCRELSIWLSTRLDAMYVIKVAFEAKIVVDKVYED